MKNKKRALVVGEDSLIYEGIIATLEEKDYVIRRMDFPKKIADPKEFLVRLVVLIFREIDESVINLCQSIHSLSIPIPILAIYGREENFSPAEQRHLGIDGALSAYDGVGALREAIFRLEEETPFTSKRLAKFHQTDYLKKLTKRQYEVYKLMIKGFENQKIAETLNISEKTVRNHASKINKILGTKNRYQAVLKYYKTGPN